MSVCCRTLYYVSLALFARRAGFVGWLSAQDCHTCCPGHGMTSGEATLQLAKCMLSCAPLPMPPSTHICPPHIGCNTLQHRPAQHHTAWQCTANAVRPAATAFKIVIGPTCN
jgi:hypothetical protein